tara:strand:+ start:2196 stop:3116 length:921 start_codon:yes stop_codon:yes gene_type:complete
MNVNQMVIIFCRTKKDVDHISEKLTLLNYKVSSYHGDLSPTARDRALKQFVDKLTNVLILTDIPNHLNGIPNIDLILFSNIPQDPDSYIQRILRLESILSINEVSTLIAPNEFKKIAFIKRVTKSKITQKKFLDIDQIINLKKEQLLSDLEQCDFSALEADIQSFSDHLLTKLPPRDLVSFLLSNGFQQSLLAGSYKSLNSSHSSSPKVTHPDSSSSATALHGSERLFIAIGKADGINDKMLIDFLTQETNIEPERFSEIKIFDTFSFFVVTNDEAEIILEIFRRKKRGKRSIVERAKGKDAKKKS